MQKRFALVLIKPSRYDDDGYVIQWFRSAIPSNSLAALYGLALECAAENVLGDEVEFDIHAFDETNTVIKHRKIASLVKNADDGMVMLVGVQSNQFPRPLDFPWVVNQAIDLLKPSLYVFVETELWPNLLRILRRWSIPSVLVNGRLSTRSFERQRLPVIRDFYRTMLNMISCCLMQSERDAQRTIELGADPSRVRCTGNIKFDQPVPQVAAGGTVASKQSLGLTECEQLLVAGSTHPGEEEAVVGAYQSLSKEFPELCLVLAPRHIERAAQVEQMVRTKGLAVSRRSTISAGPVSGTGPRVVR